MSMLSSGLKKLRKAAGIPPITLRTALGPALSVIPVIGGPLAGALAAANGSKVQTGVALLKGEVESAVDKAAIVVKTGAAVQSVQNDASAAVRNPVVLVGGGALALYLLSRGRR